MAQGILIVGESGTGKSTSLEELNPKETFIINVKNKSLPFKGWKANYSLFSKDNLNGNYIATENASEILKLLNYISASMPHIKQVVVDDLQYVISAEYMAKASENGLTKNSSFKIPLIDWNTLRALYTKYSSNDCIIVKETKIGQSAAKYPYRIKVQRLVERRTNI